jgi:adenine-specific DNA glycosylase
LRDALPDPRTLTLRGDLLAWGKLHGRQEISWTLRLDGTRPEGGELLFAYRVWSAEVMLQQTRLALHQVS